MANAVGELEVEEFAQWRKSGKPHVLIDVRTDDELALASIDGAVHIPMHEFVQRVGEVLRDKAVVVMCHAGERSYRVASFLVANGYADVFNLEGGIDAYSERVDPSVPRY